MQVIISVESAVARKYDSASVERWSGVTVKSRIAPLVLSPIIRRLEQNATVTQHTASNEEMSCPPTVALISASSTVTPAGSAEAKLSR